MAQERYRRPYEWERQTRFPESGKNQLGPRIVIVNMRSILLIAFGVILCFTFEVGCDAYLKLKNPRGPLINSDYNLVQVANRSGDHLFDLRKGESRFLGYGWYKVTIPEANVSFILWKNNRGVCDIHSGSGMPFVETDGNCRVDNEVFGHEPVQTITTNVPTGASGKTNATGGGGDL